MSKFNSPKRKPKELISALLHITIDTDETTDRDKAPIVPSWKRLLSLILPSATAVCLRSLSRSNNKTNISNQMKESANLPNEECTKSHILNKFQKSAANLIKTQLKSFTRPLLSSVRKIRSYNIWEYFQLQFLGK